MLLSLLYSGENWNLENCISCCRFHSNKMQGSFQLKYNSRSLQNNRLCYLFLHSDYLIGRFQYYINMEKVTKFFSMLGHSEYPKNIISVTEIQFPIPWLDKYLLRLFIVYHCVGKSERNKAQSLLSRKLSWIKGIKWGLSWWSSGWSFAFQCRQCGFNPWWGVKIPHASWLKNQNIKKKRRRRRRRSNIVTNSIKTLKVVHIKKKKKKGKYSLEGFMEGR